VGDEPGPRQCAPRRARLSNRRGVLPRSLRHAAVDAHVQAPAA
jgi:hypothetical protein